MRTSPLFVLAFAALFAAPAAQAKKHPAQLLAPVDEHLIQQAITHEQNMLDEVKKRSPIIETYIQNCMPGHPESPLNDSYLLSHVAYRKDALNADVFATRDGDSFTKKSVGLAQALVHPKSSIFSAAGFVEMIVPDAGHLNFTNYSFTYIDNEFLGDVHTRVYNVVPATRHKLERFSGRIWIEDQTGNIVRYSGTFIGNNNKNHPHYLHFESWRFNVQPGLWLPVAVYAQGEVGKYQVNATSHLWGYSLNGGPSTGQSTKTTIQIQSAVDTSNNSPDVDPVEAKRQFSIQAENNVLQRLIKAGLVDVPGTFDPVLEQIANNIILQNDLVFPEPVHCRVLLTSTIEATTAGYTVLLSKGLIDSMPNEESIASVIAWELAHLALHQSINTGYAFADQMLFGDTETYLSLHLQHSAVDNAAAATKAIALLNNSIYKKDLQNVGVYMEQIGYSSKQLHSLFDAQLGDALIQNNGQPWLASLELGAPKLDSLPINFVPALPLGSNLQTDPWTDSVRLLNAQRPAPLDASDKYPFAVMPDFYRLQYFDAASKPPIISK